ncbi:unnamed protein product [Caenorhabditis sp. 36 PRJEB53466]|nr:unnamed protein product [Caenorhabditis sp. 36 PRJEB53466]
MRITNQRPISFLLFLILLVSGTLEDIPAVYDPYVPFGIDLPKTCEIAEWNNRTFSSVSTLESQKSANLQGNMKKSELRVVSAFVYQHEIIVTTTAQNRYGKKVYCRYFDCNRRELNGSAWDTIMFPLSVAFCARRAGALFMGVTETADGELLSEPVPLTVRVSEKYAHEIAVCVGPIYGNESRWLEIAETTEHHLLIGATYFYYTIFDKMNEYTRKLVDEYERLGYFEVTVIQTEYEVMDWLSHLLQINDCHFRSRFHSKWVLNVDIDERLVVLQTPLPSLLQTIASDVGEVIISAKRVMRLYPLPEKYKTKEELWKELEYVKYNKTTKAMWDVPKVIFRPEKVQALFYHWTFAQYPGVKVFAVPKSQAYIRHYRTTMKSLLGIWYQNKQFNVTRMDRILEEKVTLAVTKRLESVYHRRKIWCEEIRNNLIGHFAKENYDCVWKNGTSYVNAAMGFNV